MIKKRPYPIISVTLRAATPQAACCPRRCQSSGGVRGHHPVPAPEHGARRGHAGAAGPAAAHGTEPQPAAPAAAAAATLARTQNISARPVSSSTLSTAACGAASRTPPPARRARFAATARAPRAWEAANCTASRSTITRCPGPMPSWIAAAAAGALATSRSPASATTAKPGYTRELSSRLTTGPPSCRSSQAGTRPNSSLITLHADPTLYRFTHQLVRPGSVCRAGRLAEAASSGVCGRRRHGRPSRARPE